MHDRAVDVADNFAAYFRHGYDAVRVFNEYSQFPLRKQVGRRRFEDRWQGFIVQLLYARCLTLDNFDII